MVQRGLLLINMSAFPLTPPDGDIYIKDGVRYVDASASNSWTIQADPNKTAANIKSGVSIDGVSGTFPSDGDASASDVLAGKYFYSNDATKRTGTLVPTITWGSAQTVTVTSKTVDYYLFSDGKTALVTGAGGVPIANNHDDHAFETAFASALSKTLNTYIRLNYYVSNFWTYDNPDGWYYASGVGQPGVCTLITFS